MKKIEYNQNDLSHVPKSIIYWVSQGVVIDGVRYAVKEFRVEEDKFKLVVEKNGEFFEVDASTNSGGSATIDPDSLKDYLKISDLGAGPGLQVNKLDHGVVVGLSGQNSRKLENLDEEFTFSTPYGLYHLVGKNNGEADGIPFSIQIPYGGQYNTSVLLDARNGSGKTLYSVLMGGNVWGTTVNKIKVVGQDTTNDMPTQMPERGTVSIDVTKQVAIGEMIQVMFIKE